MREWYWTYVRNPTVRVWRRFRVNYRSVHDSLVSCFDRYKHRVPYFKADGSMLLADDENVSAANSTEGFIANIKNRLPFNSALDLTEVKAHEELRFYAVLIVKMILTFVLVCSICFLAGTVLNYVHESRIKAVMRGDEAVGRDTHFRMWYHGHIVTKQYADVDTYFRDSAMSQPCRAISRREYVTRTLDHDYHVSQRMREVDFRDAEQWDQFSADVAMTAAVDLEFITHALCHHAHNLHLLNGGTAPVFLTPKMLTVHDLKAAMSKGGDEEDIISSFVDVGDMQLPNVCVMAYVRPKDDLARSDVESGAVISSNDDDNDDRRRKPFEKDLGAPSDAFVHRSNIALWPENGGYDEHMALENADRMYVVDDRDERKERFSTRTWWNSALYPVGPAGECALYVNARFRNESNVRSHDRGNHLLDVFRQSALIQTHRNKPVTFGSRVWRSGMLEHDMVLNTTLPQALLKVNTTSGFVHDGENSLAVKTAFETVEKQAESQIVINLMDGSWDVFDEIQRGYEFDQRRKDAGAADTRTAVPPK